MSEIELRIPRKLSVADMQRDPILRDIGVQLEVLVDGNPQGHCTRYDMDIGEVERFATWPDGRLKVRDGEVVTELVRGVVEVRQK
jgi:hypothetical protein